MIRASYVSAIFFLSAVLNVHATEWVALPVSGSGTNQFEPRGINTNGQVVGYELDSTAIAAILWDRDGEPLYRDIGSLDDDAGAYAINSDGRIVGWYGESGTPLEFQAYIWDDAATPKMVGLGDLGGGMSRATSINDSDLVVGWSEISGSNTIHAFLWDDAASPKMKDLGTLQTPASSYTSAAHDINNNGLVVGEAQSSYGGPVHAFLWDDSANPKMTDLGTLGGSTSRAYAINVNGLVVGDSDVSGGDIHGFVWDDADNPKMTDLNPAGAEKSWAWDINSSNEIVGYKKDIQLRTNLFAMHWDSNLTPTVLEENLFGDTGMELFEARSINDDGLILCKAISQEYDAYILAPVDAVADNSDSDSVASVGERRTIDIPFEQGAGIFHIPYTIVAKSDQWHKSDTGSAFRGSDYHYTDASNGLKFTWSFTVSSNGRYSISAQIPNRSGNTTNAKYILESESTDVTVTIDQDSNKGKVIELSDDIHLQYGTTYTVTVEGNTTTGEAIADAIAVAKIGPYSP